LENRLDAMNSRLEEAEEQISDLGDKIMENNEAEQKRERRIMQHEDRLRDLNDPIRCNIHCIGVSEELSKNGTDNSCKEIIAENFSNLGRETDIQIQETQRTLNKSSPTP
ncbi:LORF1 protein, partial [Crocuta crocuta]